MKTLAFVPVHHVVMECQILTITARPCIDEAVNEISVCFVCMPGVFVGACMPCAHLCVHVRMCVGVQVL